MHKSGKQTSTETRRFRIDLNIYLSILPQTVYIQGYKKNTNIFIYLFIYLTNLFYFILLQTVCTYILKSRTFFSLAVFRSIKSKISCFTNATANFVVATMFIRWIKWKTFASATTLQQHCFPVKPDPQYFYFNVNTKILFAIFFVNFVSQQLDPADAFFFKSLPPLKFVEKFFICLSMGSCLSLMEKESYDLAF